MSIFDDSLEGVDPKELCASILQMKENLTSDIEDGVFTSKDAEFINAAIDNLYEEIKGLKSFDKISTKQKARIVAFMSFVYDVFDEGDDFEDMFDDEESYGDDDDDDEDDDEGDDEDDDVPIQKKKKKIESFPK